MKKSISILLTICICLSSILMLASCDEEHVHSYADEWSKDETHHWHACEGEDCSEISDKSEHAWDEGEVKTKATAESDGETLFTCTACGYTKIEKIKYSTSKDIKISKEEWDTAMSLEYPSLKVTYSFYEGEDISQKMVVSVTPNAIKEEEWLWDEKKAEGASSDENAKAKTSSEDYDFFYYEITTSGEYYRYEPEDIRDNEGEHISYHRYDSSEEEVYSSFNAIKTTFAIFGELYDECQYDPVQKAYKLYDFQYSEDSIAMDICLYFVDGRLSKFLAQIEGTDVTTVVIEFEYDNVEVILPDEYHTDSSTMDCAYWRPFPNH